IVVNESDESFEFCPFCGKRMSGQMATDKHMWAGEEMPAHLDNIKGGHIEKALMNAIKETYGIPHSKADKIVKEVMPVLIKEMRDNDIPV
ncbi:MAG: hypothetical protein IJ709_10660, partial [Selenomonas sp.]|nr:hypothetical protein [Selenomonas sp.]